MTKAEAPKPIDPNAKIGKRPMHFTEQNNAMVLGITKKDARTMTPKTLEDMADHLIDDPNSHLLLGA